MLALSEKRGQYLYQGDFELTKWKETGLLGEAIVKGGIATLEKSLIYKKLGHLQEDDINNLKIV